MWRIYRENKQIIFLNIFSKLYFFVQSNFSVSHVVTTVYSLSILMKFFEISAIFTIYSNIPKYLFEIESGIFL